MSIRPLDNPHKRKVDEINSSGSITSFQKKINISSIDQHKNFNPIFLTNINSLPDDILRTIFQFAIVNNPWNFVNLRSTNKRFYNVIETDKTIMKSYLIDHYLLYLSDFINEVKTKNIMFTQAQYEQIKLLINFNEIEKAIAKVNNFNARVDVTKNCIELHENNYYYNEAVLALVGALIQKNEIIKAQEFTKMLCNPYAITNAYIQLIKSYLNQSNEIEAKKLQETAIKNNKFLFWDDKNKFYITFLIQSNALLGEIEKAKKFITKYSADWETDFDEIDLQIELVKVLPSSNEIEKAKDLINNDNSYPVSQAFLRSKLVKVLIQLNKMKKVEDIINDIINNIDDITIDNDDDDYRYRLRKKVVKFLIQLNKIEKIEKIINDIINNIYNMTSEEEKKDGYAFRCQVVEFLLL